LPIADCRLPIAGFVRLSVLWSLQVVCGHCK
jgi:hypothetical protein